MGYYKAKTQFTRATTAGMIVGHPEHRDPRGRYFEIPDAVAQPMVSEGLIQPISRATYHKGVEGGEVDGGDVLVDQVAGKRPKVSARMTNEALAAEAAARGVDISKAKNRHEIIKLINAKDATVFEPDEDQNAFSRTSQETARSTRHSRRASPLNDVGASGSVDIAAPVTTGAAAAETVEPEEEAPTGGGGGSDSDNK